MIEFDFSASWILQIMSKREFILSSDFILSRWRWGKGDESDEGLDSKMNWPFVKGTSINNEWMNEWMKHTW